VQFAGLGFEFADVDEDGATDIVTTRNDRLLALLSRDRAFEERLLGIDMAPPVKDFVVDPGMDGAAVVHLLYDVSACAPCSDACTGRCLFDVCVS
jgi:hypothetical protein